MLPKELVARLEQGLVEAREKISPHYDDVFREVQQRISAAGNARKADIAMPSFWKRLRADTRWVTKLLQLPDGEVREVTGPAAAATRQGGEITAAGDARELLRVSLASATGLPWRLHCCLQPPRLGSRCMTNVPASG